jgi:hypothetical protein
VLVATLLDVKHVFNKTRARHVILILGLFKSLSLILFNVFANKIDILILFTKNVSFVQKLLMVVISVLILILAQFVISNNTMKNIPIKENVIVQKNTS